MMSPEDMSIVCLLASPRRHCNSDLLAGRFKEQASVLGAPTKTFALPELNYNDCKNLFRCKKYRDFIASHIYANS